MRFNALLVLIFALAAPIFCIGEDPNCRARSVYGSRHLWQVRLCGSVYAVMPSIAVLPT